MKRRAAPAFAFALASISILAAFLSSCGAKGGNAGSGWAAKAEAEKPERNGAAWLPAVKDLGVPEGTILLRKYPGGYAAFKITAPDGLTVVLDPYQLDETVKADFVSISHPHEDHCDFSRIAPGAQVVTDVDVVSAKGATLRGFDGKHNKGDPGSTNIVRLVEMGGYRILHMASQAEALSGAAIAAIGKVDILIVQVFKPGQGKMDVREAAAFAKAVGARFIVTAHGDPSLNGDFAKALGAELRKFASGSAVIDKAMLDAGKPVLVADMEN